MTTRHFVYKLVPPRPTFAMDMTQDEKALMGQHAEYWTRLLRQGTVVVFGPVLDPEGSWGLAVVEAADAQEVRDFGAGDPAIISGMASFDVYPMAAAVVRDRSALQTSSD